MNQESAKPNAVQPIMNQPLLQNQQQPTNPYYAPYSQPAQQPNQVPQLQNPYEVINVSKDTQPQMVPQQVPVASPMNYTFQQQVQPFHMNQQFVPYAPQVLTNASGFRVPALVLCPFCNQHSITTISYKPGNNTYWMAVLLCLCFGFLCLIPLLASDCKDVIHQCSYCGQVVGQTEYKPCE